MFNYVRLVAWNTFLELLIVIARSDCHELFIPTYIIDIQPNWVLSGI